MKLKIDNLIEWINVNIQIILILRQMINISRVPVDSVDTILSLGIGTFVEAYSSKIPINDITKFALEEFNTDKIITEMATPNIDYYFIKTDENEIVGYGKVIIQDGVICLDKLYIRSKYHRNRYGTDFLEYIEELALEQNIKTIIVPVWNQNVGAINFYTNNGYEEHSRKAYQHDSKYTNIIMTKTLTNNNGTIKIQIVSDIHLEFFDDSVQLKEILDVTGNVLIIAGDLGYPTHDNYVHFIEQCSQEYDHVILVTGNHEYYATKDSYKYNNMYKIDTLISDVCKRFYNVHFLNKNDLILTNYLDDYVFLGTTMWSHISQLNFNKIQCSINDYNYIQNNSKKMTPSESNLLYQTNLKWLTKKIEEYRVTNKKIIVITHHMPSFRLINDKYKDSEVNEAFASNLEYLMFDVDYWIYGHTHDHNIQKINNCTCIVNAHGYVNHNENVPFNRTLCFDLK